MKTLLLVLCEYGACHLFIYLFISSYLKRVAGLANMLISHGALSYYTLFIQEKQHETYRLKWCHTGQNY